MDKQRILIVGAGVAGTALAKNLDQKQIVGYLDDFKEDKKLPVLGKLKDVNRVIKAKDVTDVYFCIPSSPALVVRNFINSIKSTEVKISILPRSFSTISKKNVELSELTDIDVLHLLGREPIKHDLLTTKSFIKGKTVLVTGAAGSIGSQLVKLLATALDAEKVICVDWWENGTFFLKEDLKEFNNVEYVIADVKNKIKIDQVFNTFKPEIVFHAAAYKHVPLMQANPIEAFNNNIWGSMNIMQAAIKHKCSNFVYVSTDKAVNPVNVMGTTKRLGEMILQHLAAIQNTTKLTAVRFGNVIQSNGSVLQIFKRQIDRGEALTVTHEDITRYFMTIEEAVQLIIQSSIYANNGEIFLLDMGEPVKIMDLAKSLIKVLNKNVEIKITGLRPGEKMFEELSFNPLTMEKTENNKIFIVKKERDFNTKEFYNNINSILSKTLNYSINNQELIDLLISMGFKIKK